MNYKKIIILITVCAAILLTGCDRSDKSSESNDTVVVESDNSIVEAAYNEKAELSEIRENFLEICERIRNNEYDNLNFKNTEFLCPEINEVSELTRKTLTGKSVDEIYEFFSESVDTLTDNFYTEEEKKHEIRFICSVVDEEKVDDSEEKIPYPYYLPNIEDYKNDPAIVDPDNPWPTIDDGNYFIDMMFGALRGFDNGALMRYDNVDREYCAMYFMISGNDKHHTKLYTNDLTCTDEYPLLNGTISIADAAAFAQDYLDNTKFTPYEKNIPKARIISANVVDIGGGKYGYDFITALEYKGVFFDYPDRNGIDLGVVKVKTDYDKNTYDNLGGHIDMIETDNISHFMSVAPCIEITDGTPQTTVITPEAAASSLSEFLSGTMDFSVSRVSMVWLPLSGDAEKEMPVYPCWKFKMNSNGNIYHTFVNMISGEIYLYIQAVS